MCSIPHRRTSSYRWTSYLWPNTSHVAWPEALLWINIPWGTQGKLSAVPRFSSDTRCLAPLKKKCPKHHGHKGDPEVTPETCGADGEKASVILVHLEKWVSGVREIQQKFCWFRVRIKNSWFRITIENTILVRCWFHV